MVNILGKSIIPHFHHNKFICDFFGQAPEIYLPHHRHGTAADWFALGVTLHEFVTGRRPFETSKLQAFRNGETNAGKSYFMLIFFR